MRQTIGKVVDFNGFGVFTGDKTTVHLEPVDMPLGIRFHTDAGTIPIDIENLLETPNRSTIKNNGGKVETVEHLLACLHVYGITDVDIECPTGEIPLLDGSALELSEAIVDAGIQPIDGEIQPLSVKEPIYVEEDEAVLIGLPADELKICYFLAYDDARIGSEQVSLVIDPEAFGKLIAPARSFIESERVEKLIETGLVKSTDTSQALIVYPDGVRGGFRVENEFACHKMLDLIGDLYLAGRPVRGHFIGLRSGHSLNHQMIKLLA